MLVRRLGSRVQSAALAALATVVLASALVGCSALVPNMWVGGWALRTYGGKPAAAPATMSFSATDVVIQTGCNQGAGGYTYKDSTLTLTGVAFTARACTDSAMAEQDAALQAIAKGPTSMHAGDKEMTIDPGNGGAVLVFDRTSGA
jgi:heat shock protein HslJ